MKIKIIKSKRTGQWYFRIIAKNGEKVAHSEGYKNKKDCMKTVVLLQVNLGSAKVEE